MGPVTRVLACAAVTAVVMSAPTQARAWSGRYLGSFVRSEGDVTESTMNHRYDLGTSSVTPGGYDLNLRTSLTFRSNPGESGTEILRSRYFGDLRSDKLRLQGQFTPWQDVAARSTGGRERNLQFNFNSTLRRAPQLALRFNRLDRDLSGLKSWSDDRRAELSHGIGAMNASLSVRQIDTRPDASDAVTARRTREWRGSAQVQRQMGSVSAQLGYDALYSTFETQERDRTFYTQSADLNSTWRPHRRLSLGGAAFVRWGRTEDNALEADRLLDERSYSGRARYEFIDGFDVQVLREYRSRMIQEGDAITDYLRFQSTFRREITRGFAFQSGYQKSVNIQSENNSIPTNSGYLLVDGRLRRGISVRGEVRVTSAAGDVSTGTQWRRLVQLRTRPTREVRLEGTLNWNELPEILGQGQRDRQWDLTLGYQPTSSFDFVGSLRSLHGEGRLSREERYGVFTTSWRAAQRTVISVNWSRSEALVAFSRTSNTVVGTDLTFWLPGEFRSRLTWRRVDTRDRSPLNSYGLAVDKTF